MGNGTPARIPPDRLAALERIAEAARTMFRFPMTEYPPLRIDWEALREALAAAGMGDHTEPEPSGRDSLSPQGETSPAGDPGGALGSGAPPVRPVVVWVRCARCGRLVCAYTGGPS